MDQGPLVKEEIDAGAELARRFDGVRPLRAVFWLRMADEPYRYLYLASDRIDDAGAGEAYDALYRVVAGLQLPELDFFRIKLIRGDHPLAEAAAEVRRLDRRPTGTRLGPQPFGGAYIDDAYIYPAPLPAAVS